MDTYDCRAVESCGMLPILLLLVLFSLFVDPTSERRVVSKPLGYVAVLVLALVFDELVALIIPPMASIST